MKGLQNWIIFSTFVREKVNSDMTPQEAVEKLAQQDLKVTSELEIRKLYEIITDLPAIIATIPLDLIITRVRPGRHMSLKDLTYPPVSVCKKMQRSSLAGESAFYASLPDDQHHLENGRALGLSETSTLARQGKESLGREFLTVSQWVTKKPLRVISFMTDKTFVNTKNRSKHIKELTKYFAEQYHSLTDVQKEVIRIIDEDFCKVVKDGNVHEYKRTAILAHDMIYDSEYNLDGIVYAPVQMEGQLGINVMLKPASVDEKLELYRVIHCSYYKNGEQSLMMIDKGYDNNGHLLSKIPLEEDIICQKIGIQRIKDLPVVKH